MIKNAKHVELNKVLQLFLEYTNFKDDLIEFKCLVCNKSCQIKGKLKKGFFNTFKFSNHENNNFFLLLEKGLYHYEYIDDWEIFSETQLPEKEDFYSHLNMDDITDADYMHTKRDCRDFKITNLGEYYDFYVQSNTLLLADVFENFRNICHRIYEHDPAKFFQLLD